jgi:hypothetical protein
MKQKDIHLNHIYGRRRSSGTSGDLAPRMIVDHYMFHGRPYVDYIDRYGQHGCYLFSFASWAQWEIPYNEQDEFH